MNLVCPNCGASASVPLEMSGYCRDHRPRLVPERIQLRRTKGWRKPEGAIVVARPSRWGNPYKVGQWVADPVNEYNPVAARYDERPSWLAPGRHVRIGLTGRRFETYVYRINVPQQAVDLYRRLCEFEGYDLSPLRGRDLACWCPLEDDHGRRAPCHADVLLLLANPEVSFAWAK